MWVKKLALFGTVFEIQAFLCFALFCEKFENSKWLPFLVGHKNFEKWVSYSAVTLWIKFFIEIALSSMVSEIQVFLKFKFKMAGIFGK